MADHIKVNAVLLLSYEAPISLYKYLAKEHKDKNIIISPVGVQYILTIINSIRYSKIIEGFKKFLYLPDTLSIHHGFHSCDRSIKIMNLFPNFNLSTGKKIYVMKEYQDLTANFRNEITEDYSFELQSINFDDSVNAANIINQWVEQRSRSNIVPLITANELNSSIRLIMVNVIYLKTYWYQFDTFLTVSAPFYVNDIKTVYVQMMEVSANLKYTSNKELDAKIVELPFMTNTFSMIIILPNKPDGIKELENKLANLDLDEIINHMNYSNVTVALPKCTFEQISTFKQEFKYSNTGLVLDRLKDCAYNWIITEKIVLDINQYVAETTTGPTRKKLKRMPLEDLTLFKVDHPFIFIIIFKARPFIVLFFGRVTNPSGQKYD